MPLAYTAHQVEAEVGEFEDRGFPLDVIGLEPGWHTHSYPTSYEWHPERFPDPNRFLATLAQQGVRVNLWENGFVSPLSPLGQKLTGLCGSHTGSWGGLVPDLTLPAAERLLSTQHEAEHLARGVSGYKLDECDGFDRWLWPDHATFPSGLTGEEMRQVFGLLLQRVTLALFRRRNQRTYGLVRGSNAGSVGFPYVLYSDCYSHRDFITALCSSGFCGLLWTPEARSSQTAEEWLRRMQAVCFSPLAMINAWADGTKPWSWPQVSDAVREAMLLRQRLVPYLYSAFARYHFEGLPPFRALALAGPGDEAPDGIDFSEVRDQYLMGDSILVAPLFAGEKERKVLLPRGRWFDFYIGAAVPDAPTLTIPASYERIPLFVRDGGIVPLLPAFRQVLGAASTARLEVRHYGQAPGRFLLYEDDGVSFDYEQGRYHWRELCVERDAAGNLAGTAAPARPGVSCYGEVHWRFMPGSADGGSPSEPRP